MTATVAIVDKTAANGKYGDAIDKKSVAHTPTGSNKLEINKRLNCLDNYLGVSGVSVIT